MSSSEAAWVSSFAALPPAVVAGITGPWSRLGEPVGDEAPARGGVGTPLSSAGGGVGTLSSSSMMLLGGGVLIASSSLVGVLAAVFAEDGCSSTLSATIVAAGCFVVCGAAPRAAATGSATLWPATRSGSTSDAVLAIRRHFNNVKTQQQNAKHRSAKVRMQTYKSERRCLPVGACASVSTKRVGSTCGAGGSLVTRPVVVGATSRRL